MMSEEENLHPPECGINELILNSREYHVSSKESGKHRVNGMGYLYCMIESAYTF